MPAELKPVRMTTPKNNSTTERLTAVEIDLSSLRQEVHTFARNIGDDMRALGGQINDANSKHEKQIEKLADVLADRGRLQPGTIVSIIAALATWSALLAAGVWFLVGLGHQPTEVKLQTLLDDYGDHKDNHGHPKMTADVAAINQKLSSEALATQSQDARLVRLEDWYNGHGQRMAQDIIRVEAMIKALEPVVMENNDDIESLDGQRFNVDDAVRLEARLVDQIKYLTQRLDEEHPPEWLVEDVRVLQALVLQTIQTRFAPKDAIELRRQLERDVDRIEAEQARRQDKIYDEGDE